MAVTFAPLPTTPTSGPHSIGDLWAFFGTLTFSGSYATGGDTLTLPAFSPGIGNIVLVMVDDSAGYSITYQTGSGRVQVYSAAGTELAAGAYPAAITGDTGIHMFLVYQ